MSPDDDAEYTRRRLARAARQAEVHKAAGWSKRPGKAWSRAARKRAGIEIAHKGWENVPWREKHMRHIERRGRAQAARR